MGMWQQSGRETWLCIFPGGCCFRPKLSKPKCGSNGNQCNPAAFMHSVKRQTEYVMRLPPAGFHLLWRWRPQRELRAAHVLREEASFPSVGWSHSVQNRFSPHFLIWLSWSRGLKIPPDGRYCRACRQKATVVDPKHQKMNWGEVGKSQ